jgi:hypothetical protein
MGHLKAQALGAFDVFEVFLAYASCCSEQGNSQGPLALAEIYLASLLVLEVKAVQKTVQNSMEA